MQTTVTGTGQTANAFLGIEDFDAPAFAKSDTGMAPEISQALGRIVDQSGRSAMPGIKFNTDPGSIPAETTLADASLETTAPEAQSRYVAMTAGEPLPPTGATAGQPDSGAGVSAGAQTMAAAAVEAPPPQSISEADIQAHLRELMSAGKKEGPKNIDKEINDPTTPPEVKAALVQLKAINNGQTPTLTDTQLESLSILQRHRKEFGGKAKDLQGKIDDPATPPDLKQALIQMRDDPALRTLVDAGGVGLKEVDGKWSESDITPLADLPQLRAYNGKKAASYVHNYIPSDADPSVTGVREMTENDALRELYLYSDYLPGKKLTKSTLQLIVDGRCNMKKCPPQVIAAARYMLDHPAEWSKATSADGSVKKSTFLDRVGSNITLNADESAVLQALDQHRDVFLKEPITRDRLQAMIDDPANTPENKKVAQKLLDDPLLFGLLDNAKHGHSTSWTKTCDDGKIGAGDIDAFLAHSTTKGKAPPPLPPTHPATTADGVAAAGDMAAGEVDDPEMKQKKGGGLANFFKGIGNVFLKIGAVVMHIASGILSVLSKIPIIGELAIPLSIAAEAAGSSLDVARVALNGGNVDEAWKMMGISVAGAAISAVALPGMGAAVMKGAVAVAEKTGVKAAEKVAEKGIATAATKGAEKVGEKSATAVTTIKGAEEGSEKLATQSTNAEAKEQLKEEVVLTTIDETTTAAVNNAQAKQRRQQLAAQGDTNSAEYQNLLQIEESRRQAELSESGKSGEANAMYS